VKSEKWGEAGIINHSPLIEALAEIPRTHRDLQPTSRDH